MNPLPRFVNCRLRDGLYYAVLADNSVIEWNLYCAEKALHLKESP
jgi:hypothetical protein